MRFLLVLTLGLGWWMASVAHAQSSYLDKKDADAIAVIERSLAKIDRIPQLFDGTAIPAGADLDSVQGLYDQLTLHLRSVRNYFFDLSDKRARMADAVKLRAKFDDLERYAAALGPVLSRAKSDARARERKEREDDQRAVQAASKVCDEFRAEIRKHADPLGNDDTRMGVLTNLADGRNVFFQNVEEITPYKAAIDRTAALCQRMPTAAASCAKASNVVPLDARYCDTAAKGAELLKTGVKNLLAFHAKNSGPTQIIKDFDRYQGFVDVDGVVGWTAYFEGKRLKEMLMKRIAPLLTFVNMSPADGESLFASLAAEYAQLEAKARETAPTWDLPGAPCSGPGCAQAKKFVQQWYRGSAIKRFLHTSPGWKILTNDFGVPTYRERYGYALVQVKGEPFCQLRMWTYSEQHAGGGRYTPGRDVHLHSVRWQTCK